MTANELAEYITGALIVGLAIDIVLFFWRAVGCVRRYYADLREARGPRKPRTTLKAKLASPSHEPPVVRPYTPAGAGVPTSRACRLHSVFLDRRAS